METPDTLTDQQITQMEINLRIAFDSGYGLNNMPIPAALQRMLLTLSAEQREKLENQEDQSSAGRMV